jgi:hypothetical protein
VAPPKPLVMDASGKTAEQAPGSSAAPAPSRFAYDTLAQVGHQAAPAAGALHRALPAPAPDCTQQAPAPALLPPAAPAPAGSPRPLVSQGQLAPSQQQEPPSTSSLQRGKDGHLTIGGGGGHLRCWRALVLPARLGGEAAALRTSAEGAKLLNARGAGCQHAAAALREPLSGDGRCRLPAWLPRAGDDFFRNPMGGGGANVGRTGSGSGARKPVSGSDAAQQQQQQQQQVGSPCAWGLGARLALGRAACSCRQPIRSNVLLAQPTQTPASV